MATFEVIGGPVTHRYLMGKTKSEIADMYMRMLRETAQDAREAELYRQQLAPVPAQGAEGVEALAQELCHSYSTEDHDDAPVHSWSFSVEGLHEFARRLRNSPQPVSNGPFGAFYVCPTCSGTGSVTQAVHDEVRLRNSPESPDGSFSLLGLIADIRAAAGDPTGKLMQEELVAHIRALRVGAERYRHYRDNSTVLLCVRADRHGGLNNVRMMGQTLDETTDAAIDAARSAGGDDEA